jgi:hypothetical protein
MSKKVVWTCDRCGIEEISTLKPVAWVTLGLTVQRPGYPEREHDEAIHLCPLCLDVLPPNLVRVLREFFRADGQAQLREGTA